MYYSLNKKETGVKVRHQNSPTIPSGQILSILPSSGHKQEHDSPLSHTSDGNHRQEVSVTSIPKSQYMNTGSQSSPRWHITPLTVNDQ